MFSSLVVSYNLTNDEDRVGDFCASIIGSSRWEKYTAIGLECDGTLVAGVVYERFTGPNVVAHIAGVPGRRWLTRSFLHAMFRYPFIQLGVARITGEVEASNTEALRFDIHLGFEHEATLKGVMPSGDLVILVMWKDKCRWLRLGDRNG